MSATMKIGQYEQTNRGPLTLDDLRYGDILCLTREGGRKEYVVFVDIKAGVNKRLGLILSGPGDYLLNDAVKISEYMRKNPLREDESVVDFVMDARKELGIFVVGRIIGNERLEKWKAEILTVVPFSSAEGIKIG